MGLTGLVAARTSPALAVDVESVDVAGLKVARIRVPKAHSEVATQAGVYLRRRIKHDGTPECVPMLPHERISRASSFGLVDVSAQPVLGCTLADFDPLEREHLRQAVQKYGADRVLLDLDDEALDGALCFTQRQPDGSRVPTLTGLLLIGREAALQQRVGFGPIQHEQMVLSYIQQHGQIKRAEVMDLCRLTEGQVKRLLQRMLAAGQIVSHGQSRATAYTEPNTS